MSVEHLSKSNYELIRRYLTINIIAKKQTKQLTFTLINLASKGSQHKLHCISVFEINNQGCLKEISKCVFLGVFNKCEN